MAALSLGLVLVAVGAILRYAIYAPNSHASWPVVGLILMIIGAIGFVVGLIFEAPRRYRRRDTYVRHADGSAERVVSDQSTL